MQDRDSKENLCLLFICCFRCWGQ